ncbi:MAG: ABC transporter substrate-binding protein [Elusimicrobiales bacterium]
MRYFVAAIAVNVFAAWIPNVSARNLVVSDDIADPMTLDPQKQFSEKNHTICRQIFDGLVRFDPDGKIEPALAVSWERINDTRVRFKLRKEVFFHNGEPFDAEAVRFSMARYTNPETGFPGLYFIDSISHVEVVDNHTVDLITKYPDGILLNRLAGLIFMVPSKYLNEKGDKYFASNPVGTGAFVFTTWEKGKQIALTANKNYWMKGYPKVDGLIFKFIPKERRVKALLSGEVDFVTNPPGTQTLAIKSDQRFTVIKKASACTAPVSFNLASGPLSVLEVRKALNYALDKDKLIRYDLLGNGKIIATFSMDGEAGHNSALKPYKFDIIEAKALLAKAGFPNGFTVKAIVKTDTERTATIIANELKKVGVKLKITLVSDADSMGEFSKGGYDMAIGDIPSPISHSYFAQAIVLYSKSPYCLGGDAKFDSLLEEMVAALNPEKSQYLSEKLDKYVYDNAMGLFTYQYIRLYGLSKKLVFTPYVSGIPCFYGAYFQ